MTSQFQLLINGTHREGSEGVPVDVLNPATGESIGQVAYASTVDLDEAVRVSERGLIAWQAVPPWERGRILKRAAERLRLDIDRIALVLTREQGKPLAEAREEIERSADFLEWGGEQARRIAGRIFPGRTAGQRIEVQPHSIDVVAAFTPWHFSMALAAKKFAGALGAGCSIICKPSQETPGSVIEMARALLEAGVHPAAVAVVFGEANQVSSRLIAAPGVAKITFTGSILIGKRLAAAAGALMKPVTMELGGHAPAIVCGMRTPRRRPSSWCGRSSRTRGRSASPLRASSWKRALQTALPGASRNSRAAGSSGMAPRPIRRSGHWLTSAGLRRSPGW